MSNLSKFLVPMVLGGLGYCLIWGAVHAYQDHVTLHAIVQVLQQAQIQSQTQQQAPPQPSPSPSSAQK